MPRVIHKENLPLTSGGHHYRIAVPSGTRPLFFANQHEQPTVWFEQDVDVLQFRALEFMLIGTGDTFSPEDGWAYLGTAQFQGGALILHCYARG